MSLKQFFKELADNILPQLAQRKKRREQERQNAVWFDEQKRKLDAHEEIEPPWIAFPHSDPIIGGMETIG